MLIDAWITFRISIWRSGKLNLHPELMQRHTFNGDKIFCLVKKGELEWEKAAMAETNTRKKIEPQRNRKNVLKLSVYGLRLVARRENSPCKQWRSQAQKQLENYSIQALRICRRSLWCSFDEVLVFFFWEWTSDDAKLNRTLADLHSNDSSIVM